ncbi:MAG: hypothetical protein WC582_01845 [Patescibacteria group bacterium]
MKKNNLNLLNNPGVIRWCYEGITDITIKNTSNGDKLKAASEIEKKWGNTVIGGNGGGQWTTKLCEDLVMEGLIKLGRKNVRKTTPIKSSLRDKKYHPDLECDNYVYEVKGSNWCITGTAGEKILGTPLKYGEVPRLFKKPLQIVLVGYQEYEARMGYAFGDLLDEKNQTQELHESLAFYKKNKIEYVAFTDILKKIDLPDGCWKKKKKII